MKLEAIYSKLSYAGLMAALTGIFYNRYSLVLFGAFIWTANVMELGVGDIFRIREEPNHSHLIDLLEYLAVGALGFVIINGLMDSKIGVALLIAYMARKILEDFLVPNNIRRVLEDSVKTFSNISVLRGISSLYTIMIFYGIWSVILLGMSYYISELIYGILTVLFWNLSGFARTLCETTNLAVKNNELRPHIVRFYGFTRIIMFLLSLPLFIRLIFKVTGFESLMLEGIIYLVHLPLFIYYVLPYYEYSDNLKNHLDVLKVLYEAEGKVKLNSIIEETDLDRERIKEILDKYSEDNQKGYNFIHKRGRKYVLSEKRRAMWDGVDIKVLYR